MYKFTNEILDKAIDFMEFQKLTEEILESNSPEKPYDNDNYRSYTEINFKRSEKIIRNIQLDKKLYNLLSDGIQNWTWILLNEPWCGDGSFIQPVIQAMSLASAGEIDLKILLRDKNVDVMNHFLTNGGMAIPKLICLDKEMNILGSWGPRPQALQNKMEEWKKLDNFDLNTKIKNVNRWYIKDKNQELQKEFIELVKNWKK